MNRVGHRMTEGSVITYRQNAQWNYICKIKVKAKPPGDWPYQRPFMALV